MELDANCVELILFLGHRKQLLEDLANWFESDQEKAKEFIEKYFKFILKE